MMVLFVWFVVWLARSTDGPARTSRTAPPEPTARAREVLAERYASGDLSTEEYRERVGELQ